MLELLQENVPMQSDSEKPLNVDRPVLHTAKSRNIFEVLGSEGLEAENKLESLVITEDATSGLQASSSPLSQATDEHDYIQDDSLAELVEIFWVLLVSGKLCAELP